MTPIRTSPRRGFTLVETLVAASLTITLLAVAAPIMVRSAKTWQETRHHQFAADELSAQMDRLLSLPPSERTAALETLSIDDEVPRVLVDALITSQWVNDSDGERIVLAIDWRRLGDPPPVTLTAWVDSMPIGDRQEATGDASQDQKQQEDSE